MLILLALDFDLFFILLTYIWPELKAIAPKYLLMTYES